MQASKCQDGCGLCCAIDTAIQKPHQLLLLLHLLAAKQRRTHVKQQRGLFVALATCNFVDLSHGTFQYAVWPAGSASIGIPRGDLHMEACMSATIPGVLPCQSRPDGTLPPANRQHTLLGSPKKRSPISVPCTSAVTQEFSKLLPPANYCIQFNSAVFLLA